MFRNIMILGLLSTLFGCGDGRPGFFSASGYHIGKDKVWYKTTLGMSYNVAEVVGADPKTFVVRELQSKESGSPTAIYGMDQQSIFWAGIRIDGADLGTFEYVINDYSKDKHTVYYTSERLTDDLANFAVISYQFVKDSKNVYFGRDVFSQDPTHFTRIGAEGSKYYKDSQKCWYDIYPLQEADPGTLHYIGLNTVADGRRVYQEMNEVEGADIKTYQILEHSYAKDAHHVYQKGVRMEGANPGSFKVLSENYSLDDKKCFYFMTPLPNADPATFQMIDEFYTKDARQVYSNGKAIDGADPASFRVLNGPAGCACDAHHAYSMDQPIKGVDPKTFPAAGTCKSCNESGVEF